MNPKFSIIIPVYDVALHLCECLDSVLAQRFGDWECICVDDGSPDKSGMILDEYAAKDCRIKVIHKDNVGVGAARNDGLDAMAGEWVLFLDGDDMLHPHALLRILEIINESSDLDAVQFSLKRFCEKEICAWDAVSNAGCEISDISETFAGSPTYNFTCIAYRAEKLMNIRFGLQIIGEDVLFLARFMDAANRIGKIKDELYGYRVRYGSVTETGMSVRKLLDKIDSIRNIINVYSCSKKFVPNFYWRLQCNVLTEMIPYEWKFLRVRDRELIRREWESCVIELLAKDDVKIPARQRIRMSAVLALPKLLTPILCQFPYWLKSKGCHR